MQNKIFFILFVLLFSFAYSQEKTGRRVTEILCSDSLYGRGYVNNGVQKAARYLANEFEAVGLTPYLDDGFFQDFSFDVNSFPSEMKLSTENKSLIPGKHFVVHPSSGGGSGIFNYIVLDSSDFSNEKRIAEAMQRISTGEKNSILVDTRNVTNRTAQEMRNVYGELGNYTPTLITTNEKFTWSVGRKQYKHPVVIINDSLLTEKPTKLSYEISAEFKKHTSQNVVGYLPSKRKRAKTIVFTAHYDHLGGMGDATFFPGANDNASGTSMLIAIAEHFKQNPSKYNLLFIAFAGEEAGLVGSEHFVSSESYPLDDIKFLLNLDIMGSGEEGITVVNGAVLKKPFKKLQKINQKEAYLKKVKPRGETANSDHYHFYKNGVPSFFIYTMGPNKHYHDIFDTYDELSFAAYNDIINLLTEFINKL